MLGKMLLVFLISVTQSNTILSSFYNLKKNVLTLVKYTQGAIKTFMIDPSLSSLIMD